jgi:hypothetical protein
LDQKGSLDVVYLDFSKAFDKVSHILLLHKFQALGVRGRCIEWIKPFLSARTFVVRVGSHFSLEKSVASGVPQGSVLDPILFLAYTSDLLLSQQTGYSAYADDLKLFGCPTDKECDLQHKVNILHEWFINWKLPLNTNKCTVMHFGKKNPKITYKIDNTDLPIVASQVDLGVTVTQDISWTEQTNEAARKAVGTLYLLKSRCRSTRANHVVE